MTLETKRTLFSLLEGQCQLNLSGTPDSWPDKHQRRIQQLKANGNGALPCLCAYEGVERLSLLKTETEKAKYWESPNTTVASLWPPCKEIAMETNSWPFYLPSTDLLELSVKLLVRVQDWPPGPTAKVNCISIRLRSPGNGPNIHKSSDCVMSRL